MVSFVKGNISYIRYKIKGVSLMKTDATYKDAKRFCKMTDSEVEMAKTLKISAENLIRAEKSAAKEKWKIPAALWVRRLYEKEFLKKDLQK